MPCVQSKKVVFFLVDFAQSRFVVILVVFAFLESCRFEFIETLGVYGICRLFALGASPFYPFFGGCHLFRSLFRSQCQFLLVFLVIRFLLCRYALNFRTAAL